MKIVEILIPDYHIIQQADTGGDDEVEGSDTHEISIAFINRPP